MVIFYSKLLVYQRVSGTVTIQNEEIVRYEAMPSSKKSATPEGPDRPNP